MLPTHRVPTPAGEILLEEFLKPLGISQVEAVRRMAIPINRLNEVIHGKRSITADTALRLAPTSDTSAEFWMNLQTASDLARARRSVKTAVPSDATSGERLAAVEREQPA